MKILVTGGCGFIGSALVRLLIEKGHEVINVDKLTYAANPEALACVANSQCYCLEQLDICDPELSVIFNRHKPDAVIHMAAESHVDRSIDGPAEFIHTNLVGTFNLLEVCRQYWSALDAKSQLAFRFLQVSTDEVYGDLGDLQPAANEQNRYLPSSPYSASKAGADHLVHAWGRTYGLPVIITHCSNNYGPWQSVEKLIPHMILRALSGRSLPIYGDGQQVRDWLYVDDHVVALHEVLHKGTVGETYNIGGNNQLRNLDVVDIICAQLEIMAPDKPAGVIHYRDLIQFVTDRPGHDSRYAIDTEKISTELGWAPVTDFEQGIAMTVNWYLARRNLAGAVGLERLGLCGIDGD